MSVDTGIPESVAPESVPDNPSAFPVNADNIGGPGAYAPEPGMTLRDWFAGQFALPAAASGLKGWDHFCPETYKRTAEHAYALADAMLRARGIELAHAGES